MNATDIKKKNNESGCGSKSVKPSDELMLIENGKTYEFRVH